ncbi:MAG: methionine adenosyltransferase, partial [Clostridia bacterium]|nr:methionine adenosyltransferase [Clostridia bacterium]
MERKLFTSESVTMGHPDKLCDRVSDAVLDAILAQDPGARVACETFTTTGVVFCMGEITTSAYADIESIVRETVREIGYDRAKYGFDCDTCAVLNSLHGQSPDIALGVDRCLEAKSGESDGLDIGAGDQGLMFGYACDETPELMPLPISLAHRMAKRLDAVRREGKIPYLRPDGKTQVTVEYDGDRPVRIEAIVVSAQHDPDVSQERIREDLTREVIGATIPETLLDDRTKIYVNPTGRFVIGGPMGDT